MEPVPNKVAPRVHCSATLLVVDLHFNRVLQLLQMETCSASLLPVLPPQVFSPNLGKTSRTHLGSLQHSEMTRCKLPLMRSLPLRNQCLEAGVVASGFRQTLAVLEVEIFSAAQLRHRHQSHCLEQSQQSSPRPHRRLSSALQLNLHRQPQQRRPLVVPHLRLVVQPLRSSVHQHLNLQHRGKVRSSLRIFLEPLPPLHCRNPLRRKPKKKQKPASLRHLNPYSASLVQLEHHHSLKAQQQPRLCLVAHRNLRQREVCLRRRLLLQNKRNPNLPEATRSAPYLFQSQQLQRHLRPSRNPRHHPIYLLRSQCRTKNQRRTSSQKHLLPLQLSPLRPLANLQLLHLNLLHSRSQNRRLFLRLLHLLPN